MPYSSKAVANAFLDIATRHRQQLDPMKLQKLIYFAHGWYLAIQRMPLIDEYVEAWQYGPVIPSLYYEFKEFGAGPIMRKARDFDWNAEDMIVPELDVGVDPFVPALLNRIWEIFGGFTAIQLSEMSHAYGGPWASARQGNEIMRNVQISNDLIQQHFMSQMGESTQNQAAASA